LGRSRGGRTIKIHLLAGELGLLLSFTITAGQLADCTQAIAMLSESPTEAVIADKGYDSDALVENIEAACAKAVIPPAKQSRSPARI